MTKSILIRFCLGHTGQITNLSGVLVVLWVVGLASWSPSISWGCQTDAVGPAANSSPRSSAEVSVGDSMQALQATAQAMRDAAEHAERYLVTIESYGGAGTKKGEIGGIRNQGDGNTTGVVISPDGYIVTSTFNFVNQPLIITVVTHDGVRRRAEVRGRDDSRKLCLLKINEDDLPSLPVPKIAPLDEIQVGQWAISMGVGYGDRSPAVSMGIISATNRIGGRAIQTDANISPANYGGPLIDIDGRLLGICVPLNPQSSAIGAGVEWYDSGIGFAIPLTNVARLIDRLKLPDARIQPAFLGVQSAPVPDGPGLRIEQVVPDSAADRAGLAQGDVILEIDQQAVNDMLKIRQVLNRFESDQTTTVKFFDRSEDQESSKEITFTVPPKPKGQENQLEPPKIR